MSIGIQCTERTRTLISTGRSSNNVFRLATRARTSERLTVAGSELLTVRELSKLDSGTADVFANG